MTEQRRRRWRKITELRATHQRQLICKKAKDSRLRDVEAEVSRDAADHEAQGSRRSTRGISDARRQAEPPDIRRISARSFAAVGDRARFREIIKVEAVGMKNYYERTAQVVNRRASSCRNLFAFHR